MQRRQGGKAAAIVIFLLGTLAAVQPGVAADIDVAPRATTSLAFEADADFERAPVPVEGRGTAEDPYRLRDLTIVQSALHGLRIAGTQAHVVVENLTVLGPETFVVQPSSCIERCRESRAVEIERARNVTIRNATFLRNSVGVHVLESEDVALHAIVLGTERDPKGRGPYLFRVGLQILDARRVHVDSARIGSALQPMWAYGAEDLHVERSIFAAPADNLQLSASSRVRLHENLFVGVPVWLMFGISNLTATQNTFRDSAGGVVAGWDARVDRLADASFCGNRFENIRDSFNGALYIHNGERLRIVGNAWDRNDASLLLHNATDALVEGNRISRTSGEAIVLAGSDVRARQNAFESNVHGVALVGDVDARDNWWGHASGPSGDGSGSGDRVVARDGATFEPWLNASPAHTPACGAAAG